MQTSSRHTLPERDRRLLDRFQEIRRACTNSDIHTGERMLADLEQDFVDRLLAYHGQVSAMAEASRRGAAFLSRLDGLAGTLGNGMAQCLGPLRQDLEEAAASLAATNDGANQMTEEHASLIRQLADRLTASDGVHLALREAAFTDEMTGLYNHRYFKEQIRQEAARFHRYGRPFVLLFMDLDLFKNVNDRHGHLVGDHVLQEVAKLVLGSLRSSDISARMDEHGFAARYGGEEFVVILPESTVDGGRVVAERIRSKVERTTLTTPGGKALEPLTISIGVAGIRPDEDCNSLIRRADDALYRAKAEGRNRVTVDSNAP